MTTHRVEKSRSNLDIVWEIHDGEWTEDHDDHSDCTLIEHDIWMLKTPELPATPRIFTLEEAMFFNNLQDNQPPEAEVVNASFRKLGVLPVGMIAAFVLTGGIILGARFA